LFLLFFFLFVAVVANKDIIILLNIPPDGNYFHHILFRAPRIMQTSRRPIHGKHLAFVVSERGATVLIKIFLVHREKTTERRIKMKIRRQITVLGKCCCPLATDDVTATA